MTAKPGAECAGLRLVHVITGLNTGGAETALCRLLASLPPRAFQHTVVALGPDGKLSGKVSELAELHHLGMRAGRMASGDLLNLWQWRGVQERPSAARSGNQP